MKKLYRKHLIWLVLFILKSYHLYSQVVVQTIDLKPSLDSAKILENPHKGWYHHYYDNSISNYLTKADSDLDNFPGMNHLYLRFAWSYLEPEEGKFNWALIDDVVNKWTAKGYTIAFCITAKETEITYATPEWVKNAGAKGNYYNPGWGVINNWEPDYGDPIFLAKLENFHRAFGARYATKTWLEYVHVGSYGEWGEGHTNYSSKKSYPLSVIKSHVNIYKKYYPGVQLYMSDDVVIWTAQNFAGETRQFMDGQGINWRDDSMLVKWYVETYPYSIANPELFEGSWRTRQTLLESQHYYIQENEGIWSGKDGSVKGADIMLGALKLTHASFIGYHGDAAEWLAENPNLAKTIANKAGYWYFLNQAVLPSKAGSGTSTLKLKWQNRGVAPAYHTYKLKIKIQNSTNTYEQYLTESDNKKWMPETIIEESYALNIPTSLPEGSYKVKVGLIEESNGQSKMIALALKDALKESDGFYTLGNIDIISSSTTPVAGNQLLNPGFEADGIETQTPSSWKTWTPDTSETADYTETYGGAHSGSYHGTHYSGNEYKVYTYQTMTNLALGSYNLSAWVKSSGGQLAQMEVKDYGGAQQNLAISPTTSWTQINISNILVSNGQCTIGFYSEGGPNEFIYFDDVEFKLAPLPNLALNKSVTFTGQQTGNEAYKAVDGNETTRWSAQTFPKSITIHLGDLYSINKTELVPYQNRAYKYKIEGSTDGSSYSLIVNKTTNATGGFLLTDNFAVVAARYVKIIITGASGYTGDWASINEIRVFGTLGGARISAEKPITSTNNLNLFPNPASNEVNVEYHSSKEEEVNIAILNLKGNTLSNNKFSMQPGLNFVKISSIDLESGIYFINISSKKNLIIKRIQIIK